MDSLTKTLALVLRPALAPVSRWLLVPARRRPTWHYESVVVALILFSVALLTTPDPRVDWNAFLIVWLSAFAVFGSFMHAKVGYRMAEAMEASNAPDVSCYEWYGKYWLTKEILWFFVFLLSGAYPAIVGTILFILYPAWRSIHIEERKKMRG